MPSPVSFTAISTNRAGTSSISHGTPPNPRIEANKGRLAASSEPLWSSLLRNLPMTI